MTKTNYDVSIKLVYFAISTFYYVLHAFRTPFVKKQFKLSDEYFGNSIGLFFTFAFFTNILIGILADKLKRPRTMLISCLCLTTIFFNLFYVSSSKINYCICMCGFLCFNTPLPGLLDRVVLEKCKNYGSQRVFDSFGYLFSSLMVEFVIKKNKTYDFSKFSIFQLSTFFCSIVIVAVFLRESKNKENIENEEKKCDDQNENHEFQNQKMDNQNENNVVYDQKKSENDSLMGIFSFSYVLFTIVIALNGISRNSLTLYLNPFYEKILKFLESNSNKNIPKTLQFFYCTLSGTLGEIIVFLFEQRITTYLGLTYPLIIGMILLIIRFSFYLLVPWENTQIYIFCLAIELLKGFGFALIHICGCKIAIKNMKSKNMCSLIYNGAYVCVGNLGAGILGSLIIKDEGGEVYKRFFVINIGIMSVALGLFLLRLVKIK